MAVKIIESGANAPEYNMQRDLELLTALDSTPQILLHFYDWEGPCATYGYFTQPAKLLRAEGLEKHGLNIARRPTGGGIIFHQYDLAFSLLLSAAHPRFSVNTLDNYRFVNTAVAEAVYKVMGLARRPELLSEEDCACSEIPNGQFCMAKPTVYDLVIDGRKVAGAAQRRTKKGYLHQGSISILLPPREFLDDVLMPASGIAGAMQQSSYPLIADFGGREALDEMRGLLKSALVESVDTYGIQ